MSPTPNYKALPEDGADERLNASECNLVCDGWCIKCSFNEEK